MHTPLSFIPDNRWGHHTKQRNAEREAWIGESIWERRKVVKSACFSLERDGERPAAPKVGGWHRLGATSKKRGRPFSSLRHAQTVCRGFSAPYIGTSLIPTYIAKWTIAVLKSKIWEIEGSYTTIRWVGSFRKQQRHHSLEASYFAPPGQQS